MFAVVVTVTFLPSPSPNSPTWMSGHMILEHFLGSVVGGPPAEGFEGHLRLMAPFFFFFYVRKKLVTFTYSSE